METLEVVRAGATIGLAVAVPLGPVGLMVIGLGRRSWPSGVAAAGGVAAADLTWALAAVAGGTALAALPGLGTLRLLARAALVAVGLSLAVRGALTLRRGTDTAAAERAPDSPGRWFAVLYGLTLPNPLTVAVFTAAALGAGAGDDAAARVVFALAVGLTSLAWQLLLAATGRHLLTRVPAAAGGVLTISGGLLLAAWPLLT